MQQDGGSPKECLAPLLQDRYRLIAVDLSSHGASTASAVDFFDHDVSAGTRYLAGWLWTGPPRGTPTA